MPVPDLQPEGVHMFSLLVSEQTHTMACALYSPAHAPCRHDHSPPGARNLLAHTHLRQLVSLMQLRVSTATCYLLLDLRWCRAPVIFIPH
jgi:hypothetical protein